MRWALQYYRGGRPVLPVIGYVDASTREDAERIGNEKLFKGHGHLYPTSCFMPEHTVREENTEKAFLEFQNERRLMRKERVENKVRRCRF